MGETTEVWQICCANCKHWELVSQFKREGKQMFFGLCRITSGEQYESDIKGAKAFAIGDGGSGAMLYSDHDFGCNQFEDGKPGFAPSCERDTAKMWSERNVQLTVSKGERDGE